MYKRSAVYAAAGVVTTALLLAAFASYFYLFPALTARVARSQLTRLEEQSGLSVQFASAGYSRGEGLVLRRVAVSEPEGPTLLQADRVVLRAGIRSLLLRRRNVHGLLLEQPRLRLGGSRYAVMVAAERLHAMGRRRLTLDNMTIHLGPAAKDETRNERLFEVERATVAVGRLPTDLTAELPVEELELRGPELILKLRAGVLEHWPAAVEATREAVARLTGRAPFPGAETLQPGNGAGGSDGLQQLLNEAALPRSLRLTDGLVTITRAQATATTTTTTTATATAAGPPAVLEAAGADEPAGETALPALPERLGMILDRGKQDLRLSVDGEALHDKRRETLRVESNGALHADGAPAGTWTTDHAFDYKAGTVEGAADLREISLPLLTRLIGQPHWLGASDGTAGLSLELTHDHLNRRAMFKGSIELSSAVLEAAPVSSVPIAVPQFRYRFHGWLDPEAPVPAPRLSAAAPAVPVSGQFSEHDLPPGSLVIESGELSLGTLEAKLRPALHGLRGARTLPYRLDLGLELHETPAQTLIDSLPPALTGELAELTATGSFALRFDLEVPTDRAGLMRWEADHRLRSFELKEVPQHLDVFQLNQAFEHTISDPSVNYQRTVRVPPPRPVPTRWLSENADLTLEEISAKRVRQVLMNGSGRRLPPRGNDLLPLQAMRSPGASTENRDARYVRLDEISDWVVRAVLTAEDNYFFWHNGINWPAVKRAVELNLDAGEYRLGASTISMQLAKNLFLNHDRVLARKLQELFIVYLMEQVAHVPKERILEIYLNVIEFGPGIFGICDAARYYFDKEPAELDILESVWLAAILPSPKRNHELHHAHGKRMVWSSAMDRLLDAVYSRERMTTEQYEKARSKLKSLGGAGGGAGGAAAFQRDAVERADNAPQEQVDR